jgi:hypothetical protein
VINHPGLRPPLLIQEGVVLPYNLPVVPSRIAV